MFCEVSECSFTKRELIPMIQRDMRVKRAPQRFQDECDVSKVDVCLCFDERVFDLVMESMIWWLWSSLDLQFRDVNGLKPLLVFNLHVQDKPSSAAEGARNAVRLAELVSIVGIVWLA